MPNALENQTLDIANAKKVYETLSSIDVTPLLEKVNGADYLSWAHAWELVLKNFPLAHFEFLPEKVYADGSMEVSVSITIHGMTRTMFLPVMTGFQNAAKPNPSARDIGDAKVRCLVKCLAMFGLGLYVYRGEGFPQKETAPGVPAKSAPAPAAAQAVAPAPANALDNKAASVKQIDAIWRGIDAIAQASGASKESLAESLLNYINKRRAEENVEAAVAIAELRYFDAERCIKYLAPKVRKAKEALNTTITV